MTKQNVILMDSTISSSRSYSNNYTGPTENARKIEILFRFYFTHKSIIFSTTFFFQINYSASMFAHNIIDIV